MSDLFFLYYIELVYIELQAGLDQDYTEDHSVYSHAKVGLTVYVRARATRASEQVAGQAVRPKNLE